MVYPQNIEVKIGFDRIKSQISSFCLSQMGEDRVNDLRFSDNYTFIFKQLSQVNEFKNILLMGESFPSSNYFDVREMLQRLSIIGMTVNKEEVFDLLGSLKTTKKIEQFFTEIRRQSYPNLVVLTSKIKFSPSIIIEADRIIDERGEIRDSASDKLLTIRHELRKLVGTSRDKIYKLLAFAKRNGWAREDAEITVRNGRVVVPILASHKRSIKGFIHDESATGQTSFVEPLELFENNNRIKELEIEEDQEIKRILFAFAEFIRPEKEVLFEAIDFLGIIDFIRAKTKFAINENANIPAFFNEQIIHWKEAIHPLLAISHREKKKVVVSQSINLDTENRVLVISGPNAGGKSVLLKTIALNQYMLQCGVPITVNPSSEAGVFSNIFIDIGDEQSIDNDLSTYSSHLKNIKYFLDNADNQSLILIDEFGSGTEPDLGGAIAAASLESFYIIGSYAVVTTHYADLKVMADKFPAMVNGAMMFDTNNLTPLFKFKPGNPGSSFAFEIAKSIGLNESVLEKAAEIVGKDKLDFDFKLQDIENERDILVAKRKEFEEADDILAEMITRYDEKLKAIKLREKEMIHKAKLEAKIIIEGANKAIENAINTIKSSGGDKSLLSNARKTVEETRIQLDESIRNSEYKSGDQLETSKPKKQKIEGFKLLPGIPEKGDSVIVFGQSAIGIVDSIKKDKVVVDFNSIKMILKLETLQKVKASNLKIARQSSGVVGVMKDIHDRAANFSSNIDVRGKRAEETLEIIASWIDEAVLTGNKNLEILHGKGDGILRMVLREMLQKNSSVIEFRDAPLEFGGYGKTIIKLK
jgi:DNA mismatch repair protein MutS2